MMVVIVPSDPSSNNKSGVYTGKRKALAIIKGPRTNCGAPSKPDQNIRVSCVYFVKRSAGNPAIEYLPPSGLNEWTIPAMVYIPPKNRTNHGVKDVANHSRALMSKKMTRGNQTVFERWFL